MPDFYLHPRRRRALLVWAIGDSALGLALVIGGPRRVSAPAFDPAKTIMPMHAWGIIALAIAACWLLIVLRAPRLRWPLAGYLIGFPALLLASWHAFFCTCFVFAITNPQAAFTGIPVYAAVAANHFLFAVDQV